MANATTWHKAPVRRPLAPGQSGRRIGVDRKEAVIRGYVLALEGPFKSEGRGEFDGESLRTILTLTQAAPNGLKSRFSHPDLSGDGLSKFLGRVRDPWMDTITIRESRSTLKTNPVAAVRGDLHFDKTALEEPVGGGKPLGIYVMDLAESDPDAISSSLVLEVDEEFRLDQRGLPARGDDGNPLPPLWRPTAIHASDVVGEGDAVDGLLSAQLTAEGLPDAVVRKAAELMNRQFAGKDRQFIEQRCTAWLARYLDRRFGDDQNTLLARSQWLRSEVSLLELDVLGL